MSNDEVCFAEVFDGDEQLTAAAVELEQRRRLVPTDRWRGRASVVALGSAVSGHANEAAFADSDASRLNPDRTEPSDPPAHYAEAGWPWPPRVSPSSFFSYGVSASRARPRPTPCWPNRAGGPGSHVGTELHHRARSRNRDR